MRKRERERERERCIYTGAYEGKEHISHIDTVVISKNKVTLVDSQSC